MFTNRCRYGYIHFISTFIYFLKMSNATRYFLFRNLQLKTVQLLQACIQEVYGNIKSLPFQYNGCIMCNGKCPGVVVSFTGSNDTDLLSIAGIL